MSERANTSRRLKAADKNTNERSQVENVSTVALIDLTDTSSASQRRGSWRRGPLLSPSVRRSPLCHLAVSGFPSHPHLSLHLFIPSLCFAPSRSLNIASPPVSFPSSIHLPFSAAPLSLLKRKKNTLLRAHTRVRTRSHIVPFQRLPLRPTPSSAVPKKPPPSA